jgi:hypothetical protein
LMAGRSRPTQQLRSISFWVLASEERIEGRQAAKSLKHVFAVAVRLHLGIGFDWTASNG